jgi:hypothetical protein
MGINFYARPKKFLEVVEKSNLAISNAYLQKSRAVTKSLQCTDLPLELIRIIHVYLVMEFLEFASLVLQIFDVVEATEVVTYQVSVSQSTREFFTVSLWQSMSADDYELCGIMHMDLQSGTGDDVRTRWKRYGIDGLLERAFAVLEKRIAAQSIN